MTPVLHAAWAWLAAHPATAATAGAAGTVVLWLTARLLRKAGTAAVLRIVTLPAVLLWEGQGLYRVGLRIHAPRSLALILAAITSLALLTFAAYAEKHYREHHRLGPNGRRMWWVAAAEGVVVAANAASLPELGLRIVLPLLSVLVWQAPYLPAEPGGEQTRTGGWVWTPRRIGIALGLLAATDADLRTVHAERHIRRLVAHGHGYHDGPRVFRAWHRWWFSRLMRVTTDEMLAETRRRVGRARTGLAEVASGDQSRDRPRTGPADVPQPGPGTVPGTIPATGPGTGTGTTPAPAPERAPKPLRKPTPARVKKMTPDELAPFVAEILGTDPVPTRTAIMDAFHVGAAKANDILSILKDPGAEIIPLAANGDPR